MVNPIRRVGVVGSGVMGSGIAAHMANAGLEVILLDIVPRDTPADAPAGKRNAIAAGNLKAALKSRPAAFFHPSRAKLVTVGNLDDDLGKLAGCDLIVEAIIENMAIKRSFFEKLDAVVSGDTVVASNTSGLRIAQMVEGRSDRFRKNFMVMHFFNPARYMKLLELVAGPETDPDVYQRVADFGRDVLGKGIVDGKDTPNFIGNRIGIHAMGVTFEEMESHGLSPEDVDAITGPPMGHPRTGTFRLADLVGLDTLHHVAANCFENLPEDEERETFKVPDYFTQMVERKILGNKTRGGFYKKDKKKGEILTLNLETLEYGPKGGDATIKKTAKAIGKTEDVRERVKKLVAAEGKVGAFAWSVLSRSLAYSARRIPEIADSVASIDDAMKWGYNWELGPFETWDAMGFVETLERMQKDGVDVPQSVLDMKAKGATGFYQDGKVWDLAKGEYVEQAVDPRNVTWEVLRKGEAPVLRNGGAEAWDLGDGVLGMTFKTKANSIDDDIIKMLVEARERAEADFDAMVIYNHGDHFSVGANLFGVMLAAQQKQWDQLREMIHGLQYALQGLKYATVPVVAAPYGMTVAGGLEVCLACDTVQAAAETYAGLVEVGVGVVPAGGGCLNLVWKALENIPDGADVDTFAIVSTIFQNIANPMAGTATSAVMAKHKGYFRHADGVSFDRARQLHETKQRALGLARAGYLPPAPQSYRLPGASGIATIRSSVDDFVQGGYASDHDRTVTMKVAEILCGGYGGAAHEVTEDHMLELEREAFLSLLGEPKTMERIQHMLQFNKPLRN
jgi:3-hydroxyacyl-CoA dehydrogenase